MKRKDLNAEVAIALGAIAPAEEGKYWHFPDPILGTTKVLKTDFEPTDPFNRFFIVVLQKVKNLSAVKSEVSTHRAQCNASKTWHYGSLGIAVCSAFVYGQTRQ